MNELPYHIRMAMMLFGIDEKAYRQATIDYEKRRQRIAEEYRQKTGQFALWYENELRRYGEMERR